MSASHSHSPTPAGASHDSDGHDQAAEAAHIAAHIGGYIKVGVGLLVLTGITVGLSYVDFGSRSMNIIVGMFVATIKASMVAAIFMHLKGEKVTIWRFLIMTAIFVFGLFMLTLLTHSDPVSGTYYSTH